MEIHGPGGISGPERLEPQRIPQEGNSGAPDLERVSDRVEISEEARLLEKLAEVPPIRTELVDELRRLIEAGEYETAERIDGAVEKLLEEIL